MRVLALDTATEACSAALLTERGMFNRFEEVGRAHAERILVMVDAVLREAGIAVAAVDCIASSIGPGAFTGVRIAVSVAQGLAFGAGVRVVGVTTLEALALKAMQLGAKDALVCLDARMGEVYWGCYSADATRGLIGRSPPAVGPPGSVSVPFIERYQGIGRGFAAYPLLQMLPGIDLAHGACAALPDAREIASLGAIRFAAGHALDPADLTPLYLRNRVALTEAERARHKESTK